MYPSSQQYQHVGFPPLNPGNQSCLHQSSGTVVTNVPQYQMPVHTQQILLPMQSQQIPLHMQPQQTQMPMQQIAYQNLNQPMSSSQILKPPRLSLRMMSTDDTEFILSDEEEESSNNETGNKNPWQVYRKRKRDTRQKNSSDPGTPNTPPAKIQNRYAPLSDTMNEKEPTTSKTNVQQRIPKPPPIFIYGVKNFKEMQNNFSEVIEDETYYSQALPNDTVKISTQTVETYRKLVRHLKEENIIHHTYQIREERAYRVVIRHLHHSIPIEDIKAELEKEGHKVRNIMNVKHRVTKEPLSLFFVDLEPQKNNKEIFDQLYLCNTKITVEAPNKNNNIIQCTRCQAYSHSKTYCTKPYNCVKCGEQHDTRTCKKPRNVPAKCVLCNQDHPANYKGCTVYQELV